MNGLASAAAAKPDGSAVGFMDPAAIQPPVGRVIAENGAARSTHPEGQPLDVDAEGSPAGCAPVSQMTCTRAGFTSSPTGPSSTGLAPGSG